MVQQSRTAEEGEEVASETSQEYVESDNEYGHGARSMYRVARSEVDTIESTRSLYDSDFDYMYLGSRKYIADYYLPIDEQETNRWCMLHYIYYELLGKSNTTVPLENPRRILDVGTGRGDWAADIGAEFPAADVIGSDIAPLQLKTAPANVFWELDDAEFEGGWNYTSSFDLIHFRGMKGAFKDWSQIYGEAYKHLEPGGWVEVLDYDNYDDIVSRFNNSPEITEWYEALVEAMRKSPRPLNAAHLEPDMLKRQGFEDVSVEIFEIPMGAWGKTKQMKTDGLVFLKLQMAAMEPLCLRTLHEYGDWSVERIQEACDKAIELIEQVATNPKLAEGCVFRVKILKGRKPSDVPASTSSKASDTLLSVDSECDDGQSITTITKDNPNGRKHS